MKVTRDAVVEMFQSIGFKTADQWSAKKIQVKVNNLQEFLADTKLPEEIMDDKNHLLNKIAKALDADEKVEVEGAEELAESKTSGKPAVTVHKAEKTKKAKKHETETGTQDEEEDVKKDKKVVKTAKTKKADKVVKEKKAGAEKDKFGCRVGTTAAAINKALTTKPQTMRQLMAKAGSEGTVYNHMKALVEAGHVKKTDEGYALTGK